MKNYLIKNSFYVLLTLLLTSCGNNNESQDIEKIQNKINNFFISRNIHEGFNTRENNSVILSSSDISNNLDLSRCRVYSDIAGLLDGKISSEKSEDAQTTSKRTTSKTVTRLVSKTDFNNVGFNAEETLVETKISNSINNTKERLSELNIVLMINDGINSLNMQCEEEVKQENDKQPKITTKYSHSLNTKNYSKKFFDNIKSKGFNEMIFRSGDTIGLIVTAVKE